MWQSLLHMPYFIMHTQLKDEDYSTRAILIISISVLSCLKIAFLDDVLISRTAGSLRNRNNSHNCEVQFLTFQINSQCYMLVIQMVAQGHHNIVSQWC